jgi:hypothetical protein
MLTGVPLGTHTAWLSISSSGWPVDVTRVAPIIHWAVTQGVGAPLVTIGQPEIANGAAIVTVGEPLTVTRVFGTVACACPPWLHITVAPT